MVKKRYLIAGAYGLAGAALAAALRRRPRRVDWDEHRATMHHAEHSRFADIDDQRVHYQEAGEKDAPAVILIHGFCASTFVWSDVLLDLAGAGFRVIAPDLIGYGFSAKPRDARYTIESQAQMVVRLLDHLDVDRATLVGSSYGGAVAISAALDHPARVARLVVVSGISDDEIKNQKLMRLGAAPLLGEGLSPLVLSSKRLHRWTMKDVYDRAQSERLWSEARLHAHRLPLLAADTHRAVVRTLRRWNAARIGGEAHRVRQPTLLVWGDRDTAVPLRHGLHFLARIPDSRLFVFPHCGHLPQEEYPQQLTELIVKFCRGALPPAPRPENDRASAARAR